MTELMSKPIVCIAKVIAVKLLSSYYTFQNGHMCFHFEVFFLAYGQVILKIVTSAVCSLRLNHPVLVMKT
jgi:hypothetical protein